MHKRSEKWIRNVYMFIPLLVLGLAGCSMQTNSPSDPHSNVSHNQSDHHMMDMVETTSGSDKLPSFLNGMDSKILSIYPLAANNEKLLQYIPCYCGCGESVGHKSNFDCFVREMKKDGSIVWDSHGMKCETCLDIAYESVQLQKQGKSPLEIRQYIDQKYSSGYAKPTPTPMPSA